MPLLSAATRIMHAGSDVTAIYRNGRKVWPYLPLTIPGAKIILEAQNISGMSDGQGLSTWKNLGAGTDATKMPSYGQPTFQTNQKNGKPSVRISASSPSGLRATYTATAATTPYMTLVVGRMRDVGSVASGRIFGSLYPDLENWLLGWWNGTEDTMYGEGFVLQGADGSVTGDWHIYSCWWDGTNHHFRRNGVDLPGTPNNAGQASPHGGLALGGYSPDGTNELSNADVCAGFIYDHPTDLTSSHLLALESYAFDQYGDPTADLFLTAVGYMGHATYDPAIRELVLLLKQNNLWPLLDVVYPFIGTTAADHKWNLKNPVDTDAANRLTWHGTITHDANGARGDGLSGWADTHYVPSAHFTTSNASMGFYTPTNAPFTKQYDMGASDAASTTAYMISAYFSTTNKSIASMGNTALTASNQYPPGANSTGMYIANRPDSTHSQLWRNGVSLGSTLDPGNACNTPLALMAINVAGTSTRWSILGHSFSFIGRTLTATQVGQLTAIVQQFQTALGRAV